MEDKEDEETQRSLEDLLEIERERRVWTHVTLDGLQAALDSGKHSDACDMLEAAPNLALETLMNLTSLGGGQGLLHMLATNGHHTSLTRFLALVRAQQAQDPGNPSLDADIVDAVNKQDSRGRTALHCAAQGVQRTDHGAVLCASSLVDARAMTSVRDLAGQLPLHRACAKSHLPFVQFLIKLSILQTDLHVSDNEGHTGLTLAAQAGTHTHSNHWLSHTPQ